ECVDGVGVRLDGVFAAPDEFRLDFLSDPLLDFKERRIVHEHRDADHSDRCREKRSAACERIAACGHPRRTSYQRRQSQKLSSARHDQLATMLTSRPPATTTLRTVFPSKCFTTCGSE